VFNNHQLLIFIYIQKLVNETSSSPVLACAKPSGKEFLGLTMHCMYDHPSPSLCFSTIIVI